jgi:hypothetical protein
LSNLFSQSKINPRLLLSFHFFTLLITDVQRHRIAV